MKEGVLSFMPDLSRHPDFSVAIKLYKNPEIRRLDDFLFI
jgi:hypothetical protein